MYAHMYGHVSSFRTSCDILRHVGMAPTPIGKGSRPFSMTGRGGWAPRRVDFMAMPLDLPC